MIKKSKITEYISYLVLILIIIFSPVPYGSVERWSRDLVTILCLVLFSLVALNNRNDLVNLRTHKHEKIFIMFFFVIVLFQIIPLPSDILNFIGPENLHLWESNQGILGMLGIGGGSDFYPISLYPHVTWVNTIELFAYFAFGYSVSRICRSEKSTKLVLVTVFIVAMIESVTGIIQFFSPTHSFATGTFINRNHYSGLLELSVFILIGYVLSLHKGNETHTQKRNILAGFISDDNFARQLALIFVLSMTVVSLFLSFSRMGIISFLSALAFMHIIYKRYSTDRIRESILITFFIIIGIIYVILIGFHPLINRFLDIGSESSGRLNVWSGSIRIIKEYPFFGTGLGTFKYIYPQYKKIEKAVNFNFAHNDYLQLLVETGVAGFVCLITALILFLKNSLQKLRVLSLQKNRFNYLVKLGALCSIISILIHSLADFNLHIPSNAVYFSLMIGIVISEGRKRN